MARWNTSMPIIQESASAMRNYVRKAEYTRLLKVDTVDTMITLARDPKYEKIKPVLGQALKMMTKIPDLD